MKPHFLRSPVSLALASLTVLLSACGGGGGGELVVETPPLIQAAVNARHQIVLVDSVTGAAITDPLKLTFVGAPELKAADGSTLNDQTVTTSTGLYALDAAFKTGATEFTVQVADGGDKGWIATGRRVVGEPGATGDKLVTIKMVSVKKVEAINASAAPVAMAVQTATATADGATAAPVAVVTAPKTVTTEEGATQTIGVAKLELATGTKGTTSTGATAAPGPLTVSSTYYSNANNESLQAFPGGFAATVTVPTGTSTAVLNGAAADSGAFVTGGFAQFNVTDSQGKAIKNFDKPVTVGIDLPKNSLDQDGNPIKVGSEYPVWSYDDAKGTWVFEKMGKVAEKTPVDPENFTVVFETNHLSSWNLDFYEQSCTARVNLVGRPAGDARQLQVSIIGIPGRRYANTLYPRDSNLTISRTPTSPLTITVTDRGKKVGQITNQRLCSGTVSIPITLEAIPAGTVVVETSEACPDGSQRRPVTTYVQVNQGNTWLNGYTAGSTNGTARFQLNSVPTGSGVVYAWDPRGRKWMTQNVTINNGVTITQTFTFPMACKIVSGGSGG